MSEFTLLKYDKESSDQAEKNIIKNYIRAHLSKIDTSIDEAYEQLLFDIAQYQIRLYVIYDGGYPFGILVASNQTFYYHQVIHFIYVEEKYRTVMNYNAIFDLLLENKDFRGLSIVSSSPISSEYTNAGFIQVEFKNPDKSLIYLRSPNEINESNKQEYLKKQVNYLKGYKIRYNTLIYVIVFFIFSLFSTILAIFNDATSTTAIVITVTITILLFAGIFISNYEFKKHNQLGKTNFGFVYDLTYINLYQYKFNDKSKEFYSSLLQTLINSGL